MPSGPFAASGGSLSPGLLVGSVAVVLLGLVTLRAGAADADVQVLAPTAIELSCGPSGSSPGAGACTATVLDTGTAPTAPTGSVEFSSEAQGVPAVLGSCTLYPAGADRATCTLTYSTAATGAARITARYRGDESHGASQAEASPQAPAPETKFAGRPSLPLVKAPHRSLRIPFVSDQPDAGFECKLDRQAYRACQSPFRVRKVGTGSHVFRVRAVNPQGLADPTPAVYRWKVLVAAGHRRGQASR